MQKFFFHQMDIRRRNERTVTDLKVLTQLQVEIEKFHQIANLPVLDLTEENSYKEQVFIALKNIGKLVCQLSKRLGDLCDGNPQIPWSELSAMAVYFQQFQDRQEFYRLDRAQISIIAEELEQLSLQIPGFITTLETHYVTQIQFLNDAKLLQNLIEKYRNLSSELKNLYVQLNNIQYDLTDAEFKKKHAEEMQDNYVAVQAILQQIEGIIFPAYFKMFEFKDEDKKIITNLHIDMAAVLVKYDAKNRNKLILSVKLANELLILNVLGRDIDLNDSIFSNIRFPQVDGKKSIVKSMTCVQALMRESLDKDNINAIVSAIHKLHENSDTDNCYFRAAILYVLVLLGETCKTISTQMKVLLPKEFLSLASHLRDKIIHSIDNTAERQVLEHLLSEDQDDLLKAIFFELKHIAIFFQNLSEGKVSTDISISYNTEVFDMLVKKFENKILTPSTNIAPVIEYPEQALQQVLNHIGKDLLNNSNPWHSLTMDFYVIYCGELSRALEGNNFFFYAVATEDDKEIIAELTTQRGDLAHQSVARGFGGITSRQGLCKELIDRQQQLKCLSVAMELKSLLLEHSDVDFLLLRDHLERFTKVSAATRSLCSSQVKEQNKGWGFFDGFIECEQRQLAKLAVNNKLPLDDISDRYQNVFLFGTAGYNPEKSPSKLPESQTKNRLAEIKTSPQKSMGHYIDAQYKKDKEKYVAIIQKLSELVGVLETLQEKDTTDLRAQLIIECKMLGEKISRQLNELETVREMEPFLEQQFRAPGAPLRKPAEKAKVRTFALKNPNIRKKLFAADDESVAATDSSGLGPNF